MRVLHWPEERPEQAARMVAVGAFDGLHRGHQRVAVELCRRARQQGWRSCLVTFEPVPTQVFSEEPPYNLRLTTEQERLRLLEVFCLDEVCILDFSLPELRAMRAEDFVREVLHDGLGARAICGAPDHRMGSDHAGWDELAEIARGLGMEALVVEVEEGPGGVVSSTKIRELVWEGRMEEAAELLGRDYTVLGKVETGEAVGRGLGFPTANLEILAEKLLPPDGVYGGWVQGEALGDGPLDVPRFGGAWPAATNLGSCPTVKDAHSRTFEAHIIDWAGNAYGAELTVGLRLRLRGEECFPSQEALMAQIGEDVGAIRRLATAAYPRL
jgi:riboflavin kinase/FMN adenylyltransferase